MTSNYPQSRIQIQQLQFLHSPSVDQHVYKIHLDVIWFIINIASIQTHSIFRGISATTDTLALEQISVKILISPQNHPRVSHCASLKCKQLVSSWFRMCNFISTSLDPRIIAIREMNMFSSFKMAILSLYFIWTPLFADLHVCFEFCKSVNGTFWTEAFCYKRFIQFFPISYALIRSW